MRTQDLAALLGLPDLADHLVEVERGLGQALRSDNTYLFEPGLRVVEAGGKRLRPVLAIAAAAAVAGEASWSPPVRSGAVSVELVHVGSLVHDDIIDDADERRGVPTVNCIEGSSHAILVGDYLLARAGVEAARVSKEVAEVLAETIADLCDGQSRETVDLFNVDRQVDSVLKSVKGKTAALMRASCRIGALCTGCTGEQVEALSRFGEAFGMAFQIVDDVLDIVSTTRVMGKPVGNDLKEGVYTLPVLYALQDDHDDLLRSRLGQLINDPASVSELLELVKANGAVEQALDVARRFNRTATEALATLDGGRVVAGLAKLPDAYLEWALSERTAGRYTLVG